MQQEKDQLVKIVKQWKPISDIVLILPDKQERENDLGISRGELSKENLRQSGLVLSVGPGRQSEWQGNVRQTMDVAIGDRVLFKKHAGDEILVNDNGTTEAFVGDPPRESQLLVVFVRQQSIITII